MSDEERHELVLDRRQMLKRAGLGAAALAVPASVMATPAMGAVAGALAATWHPPLAVRVIPDKRRTSAVLGLPRTGSAGATLS